ncbi:MAG: glycosyltransferase family 9 protein [Deltaproteobacteria bacterium]|nr:glycosyltransferase family 9 protein [Deltaproteobacteria bacterium]
MSPSRFLLIQLRQIGDVVLTTPIARILKEAFPGSHVAFLTERPSDQLLRGNPFLDDVLLNDRKGSWRDTLGLGLRLRRERFDVVLDFIANPRSALLAFLSGAPMRVAYPVPIRKVLYTHSVPPAPGYAVAYKKSLLEPLGVHSAWDRPEVFLDPDEKAWAAALRTELLGGRRRLVTLDPTHRRATRKWPAEHFGRLSGHLDARCEAACVVLWGPGEETDADAVVRASSGTAVKAPATRLREMAALIGAADLHVGNCSAPRHVAVAVGTPTFTIRGATSGAWTHPAPEHTHLALGLECQPCNRNRCDRGLACLTGLTADAVADALCLWARDTLGWDLG